MTASSVYGSTAIGDFGRFESNGQKLCDPSNPRDTAAAGAHRPRLRRARPGRCGGRRTGTSSFAPTTVAGGMTFNGLALAAAPCRCATRPRDASSSSVKLPQANWSGIATVGDALVLGLGSTYSPQAAGIEVMTPGGKPPVVPTRRLTVEGHRSPL